MHSRPGPLRGVSWSIHDASGVHVVPCDDLIHHALTDECACGPTCEPVPRDDGTFGWVYTHHSLDGREHNEHENIPDFIPPKGTPAVSIKLPFKVSHAVQVAVAILSAIAAIGTQTVTALTGVIPTDVAAAVTSVLATIAAIAGFIQKAEPLIEDAAGQ